MAVGPLRHKTHPMRTLLLSLLLGFQVFASSAFAGGADTPPVHEALERELFRQIDKYVSYPLLGGREMDGEVLISLVIDQQGQATVIEAQATSAELLAYVLRCMERVDVGTNPTGSWRITHLHFTFGPEV